MIIRQAWETICATPFEFSEEPEPEPSEDVLEGRPDMGSIEDHYKDNGTR